MLSDRIKELRVSYGLTQVELAEKLNVTKQCVSNWENNNIQPSIDMLVKLSRQFSVSTDDLLCLEHRRFLDISALTDTQAAHIHHLVNDLLELQTASQAARM